MKADKKQSSLRYQTWFSQEARRIPQVRETRLNLSVDRRGGDDGCVGAAFVFSRAETFSGKWGWVLFFDQVNLSTLLTIWIFALSERYTHFWNIACPISWPSASLPSLMCFSTFLWWPIPSFLTCIWHFLCSCTTTFMLPDSAQHWGKCFLFLWMILSFSGALLGLLLKLSMDRRHHSWTSQSCSGRLHLLPRHLLSSSSCWIAELRPFGSWKGNSWSCRVDACPSWYTS